jgi:hypothetical protein
VLFAFGRKKGQEIGAWPHFFYPEVLAVKHDKGLCFSGNKWYIG